MKKKAFLRGLLGFPLGISVGYIITILISFGWGDGTYTPCVPELLNQFKNEINAVIFQSLLCGILGAASAAASVIWEIDHWSIVKQTGIYFIALSSSMLPIAYFTYWMKHTITGFISYVVFFVIIFIVIWIIQYTSIKRQIKNINNRVSTRNKLN